MQRPNPQTPPSNPRVRPRSSALVFLIGLSGSGKTTVGRLLAARLGVPFLDLDAEIERGAGHSVREIFASAGEAAFRSLERDAVAKACRCRAGVAATGGGAPLDPASRSAMREAGLVFWLDAADDDLAARLADTQRQRPLLAGELPGRLAELRGQRAHLYAAAGIPVDASGPAEQVVERIIACLDERCAPVPVWVRTASHTYPVYVGSGVLQCLPELMRCQRLDAPLRIIADERVAALHGDALREALGDAPQTWYLVPAGEEHKTLQQAEHLYDVLLRDRPERRDVIVAFGGGVIGDMAGFVAATLLRGLRFIQIPTTVLSQVDSSVGGKVGVDHPRGKNLIGAFHQPSLVVADVDLLRTLPPREIAAGWAEVVKIAVVQDAQLFDELERSADDLARLEPTSSARAIRRSVELKARLVEVDERDLTGARAVLNYGHTLGHALEAATGYGALLHGEGVAIGMAGAAHIACGLGLHPAPAVARQGALLRRLSLPQACPDVSPEQLRSAVGFDKKRVGGRVTWVLPAGLGSVRVTADVPDQLVAEAIHLVTGRATGDGGRGTVSPEPQAPSPDARPPTPDPR